MKKLHTVQSQDREIFDRQVNILVNFGCRPIESTYKIIEKDENSIYSMIIVINTLRITMFLYDNGNINQLYVKGFNNSLINFGRLLFGIKDLPDNQIFPYRHLTYSEDGNLIEDVTYKKGVENGTYYEYDKKWGFLSEKGTYTDGKKEGKYTTYYTNSLRSIGTYKDGNVHGEYIMYMGGKLYCHLFYKNGEMDGPSIEYYKNGKIKEKVLYKNGRMEGTFQKYYDNGILRNLMFYKDGKLNGEFEYYDENGILRSKGNHKDGKKDGKWINYEKNGKIKGEERYILGEIDDLPF